MTTAILAYKEVFQLAETKGFRSHIESIDYNTTPDSELLSLLYATQIQKWLRDEHKIDIFLNPHYKVNGDVAGYLFDVGSCLNSQGNGLNKIEAHGEDVIYEQSLLKGIAEALKLL